MKINLTPTELIDQLRAWFFPKDRSIYLANNCYIYLPGPYQIAMARIAETTLSVAAASITFSAIPQVFRHLLLVGQARTDRAAESDDISLGFNGDAGNNYDYITVISNTGATAVAVARATLYIDIARVDAANSRANNWSIFTVDIPGYSLTNREKWVHSSNSGSFGDVSADLDMSVSSRRGRWRSTAAITSLTLGPVTGNNLAAGTIMTLYGIL